MRANESAGKAWDTRYSFDAYLRTGRLIQKIGSEQPVEVKFNPWHDPDDGRFTFTGSGVYYGGNGTASEPGEGYGGAGASGSWESSEPRSKPQPPKPGASREGARRLGSAPNRRPAQAQPKPWKQVTRNGYAYSIDQAGRTRLVSGSITLTSAPARSRTAQARAGGLDRRPTDDGGHYIAHRFNGPTDAFNHFAQNANFNRGGYRVLEDKWTAAKREGKHVQVTIIPSYNNSQSHRPSSIDVTYTINKNSYRISFANEVNGGLYGN